MNYAQTIDWLYNQLPFYQNQGETAYKKDIGNVLNFCKKFGKEFLEKDASNFIDLIKSSNKLI